MSGAGEFGEGAAATEQHPIHYYEGPGEFVVTLNVEGPQGKARRVKVYQVVLK